MTERTVTVQTEEEQTVTICDHCGLGDDEGEIIAFKPQERKHWGEIDCMDIHLDCLEDLGVEVPDQPTFADVYTETQPEDGPVIALPAVGVLLLVTGILILCLGALGHDPILITGGMAVTVVMLGCGYKAAQSTMEEYHDN